MNHKRKPSGLPHGYILTVSAALQAVFRIPIDFALLDPDPRARKLAITFTFQLNINYRFYPSEKSLL
jgi:hypothetical protein